MDKGRTRADGPVLWVGLPLRKHPFAHGLIRVVQRHRLHHHARELGVAVQHVDEDFTDLPRVIHRRVVHPLPLTASYRVQRVVPDRRIHPKHDAGRTLAGPRTIAAAVRALVLVFVLGARVVPSPALAARTFRVAVAVIAVREALAAPVGLHDVADREVWGEKGGAGGAKRVSERVVGVVRSRAYDFLRGRMRKERTAGRG